MMDTTSSSDGDARAMSREDAPAVRWPAWWLLASGALLGVLSANRWSIPELAWIAQAPLLAHAALHRARRDRAWLALTVFVTALASTAKVITAPIPWAMALVFAAPAAVSIYLGMVLFSWLVRRVAWGRAVVAFSAASAVVDWLTFTQSPLGTWNMAVNSQLDNLALLQALALGGVSTLSWLFAWSNATAALALAAPADTSRRRPLAIFAAMALLSYGCGFARLEGTQPGAPIRAAAVTTDVGPSPAGMPSEEALRHNEDQLFARSARAVALGARLVVWNEAATLVAPAREAALVERGRAFARDHGVELVLAYATLLAERPPRFDNQYRWFDARGVELERYRKHRPVPGEGSVAGTDPLRALDRPWGRAAGAICYDFDFPELGLALGRLGVGLAVVPSSDWRGVDPSHGQVARLRAIESGFSVLRPVRHATTFAFDAYGRTLAARPPRSEGELFVVAELPTAHVATPYQRFGDWPVALAIASLLALTLESFVRSRRALDA